MTYEEKYFEKNADQMKNMAKKIILELDAISNNEEILISNASLVSSMVMAMSFANAFDDLLLNEKAINKIFKQIEKTAIKIGFKIKMQMQMENNNE